MEPRNLANHGIMGVMELWELYETYSKILLYLILNGNFSQYLLKY